MNLLVPFLKPPRGIHLEVLAAISVVLSGHIVPSPLPLPKHLTFNGDKLSERNELDVPVSRVYNER